MCQREYYNIVKATGIQPAEKTGMAAALACGISAAILPGYHEAILPLGVSFLMTWLLLFKKKLASIPEMSSTLMGIIYFGYLPSFWIRLRFSFDAMRATLFPSVPLLSQGTGAMVLWWTWCSIVCSDVGAYFSGMAFGKTKLSEVCAAAGAASPNKTVEGFVGGALFCTAFFSLGARYMLWPRWCFWGPVYGAMLSFLGLVGDLTVSMMKRDASVKDTGNILPGHGGLLDRIDSYMLSGPLCYFLIQKLLFPMGGN